MSYVVIMTIVSCWLHAGDVDLKMMASHETNAKNSLSRDEGKKDGIIVNCEEISLSIKRQTSDSFEISIKNDSGCDLYWYKYFVNDRGRFVSDILTIIINGGAAEYTGVLLERVPPRRSDFHLLKRNDSYRVTINIKDYYDIDELYKNMAIIAKIEFIYLKNPSNYKSIEDVSFCTLKSNVIAGEY